MSIEIESADVVRLIQQYLKESNLVRTLQVMKINNTLHLEHCHMMYVLADPAGRDKHLLKHSRLPGNLTFESEMR